MKNVEEKKIRYLSDWLNNDKKNMELLTTDELAKYLKVPKSWVYSRTRETGPDSIPRIRVGRYNRFELNAVMEWLKNRD